MDEPEDLTPPPTGRKMGRPALYVKPVKCTFMLTREASDIVARKASDMRLSRSDVCELAIRHYDRRSNKR